MTIWDSLKLQKQSYSFASKSTVEVFVKAAEYMGCSANEIAISLKELDNQYLKKQSQDANGSRTENN